MPESTVEGLNTCNAFRRSSSTYYPARKESGGLALARAMYGNLELQLLLLNLRDGGECLCGLGAF